MAQIKTVTTTSGENIITFDSFYPYVWIRNTGDNDITAANYSGASAGDVNTVSIKAGEVAMIQAETENIYIIGATTAEIHAQGFAECPFKRGLGGGEQISVESLSVTTNGTYTAPTGTAYSPVVVDVVEQPWSPLQDGYSNFWFELTDDTLSPWLNFSAKNADAVIDWGDGSGEVALDTLTPTHTYAKAGRYVVKVKGVIGVARQNNIPYGAYMSVIKNVELNSEITTIASYGFMYCVNLDNISISDSVTNIGAYAFFATSLKSLRFPTGVTSIAANIVQFVFTLSAVSLSNVTIISGSAFQSCSSITSIEFPNTLAELGNNAFQSCISLTEVTLPSSITSIGSYIFQSCSSLGVIHIQATVPPALIGSNHFAGLPTDYIIYVPVGYGDTYKAAAGWSAYSDHILEEGQTVTKAMQRKFAKEKALEEDTGDMR